jgi:hypothetical protein
MVAIRSRRAAVQTSLDGTCQQDDGGGRQRNPGERRDADLAVLFYSLGLTRFVACATREGSLLDVFASSATTVTNMHVEITLHRRSIVLATLENMVLRPGREMNRCQIELFYGTIRPKRR